ncbi:MAG: lysophospholipid acyltransferase family protein [Flavobacteriaceae bacterium]|nr:lysophospholipid acyltransferase family protein [Flavobacteriaceae bacterium]
MQFLIFILVYPIIWLLSILPMRVLYFLSDIIYILIYHIIGYRKKVVRNNLKLSFPKKSQEELLVIEKKSFHHFVDVFMEMIKSFNISEKEISKRIVIENPDGINKFITSNKNFIIVSSHYGNWEWAPYLINKMVDCTSYAAYAKIQNKYFEKKMKSSRTKFGVKFILSSKFINKMQENFDNKKTGVYGFLSDQSPMLHKAYYWSNFMGIRVPVITGHEMLAKKFNYPVVYLHTEKVKRGYYKSKLTVLTENPNDFPDYQITDMYLDILEKQIREKPEYYFWTHARFKHVGKEVL